MDKFKYPDFESCLFILDELGIDKTRLDLECQDWEYTIPNARYIEAYIELYRRKNTTDLVKKVLGCFIIQSLEDILRNGIDENAVMEVLTMLTENMVIHN